jgi:3-dehydroquinate synthase
VPEQIPEQIEVALGDRSYPIRIGDGLLGRADAIVPWLRGRQVMVVTNETVGPLYLERLHASLPGCRVDVCTVPDGESYKTLATYEHVLDALMAHRHDRSTTIVALGGGVVGDIAGFVAATYQRGVDLVQVPTTLLAQVDSSVGGKTAVNHPRGKNMIGAFHQPRLVVADTSTLASLGLREYLSGIAEVVKYGVIRDRPFFERLEAQVGALRARDGAVLAEVVRRSCENKASVVAADERESGERATLNFGHTFGHAIEVLTDFAVLHGESVSIGMAMAADLSCRLGWIERADVARLSRLLAAFGLPTAPPPGLDPAEMRSVMSHDKKVQDGRIRLVLMRGIGRVEVTDAAPAELLDATLARVGACDD